MKLPLSEYPRMQLVRDSYLSLNGEWEYAITKSEEIPAIFDGVIIVPFSPETPLSGVKRHVGPHDFLIYRKRFNLDINFVKYFVFLHFGAVDQIATVILNGVTLGTNTGGFHPFTIEIGVHLKVENELIVIVKDVTDTSYHSRGKQKLKRGQIWYTPQSGIYLPVWLESTPREYIKRLKITPLYDDGEVEITVFTEGNGYADINLNGEINKVPVNFPTKIKVKNFISWTPDNPHLYPFSAIFNEDKIESYFAMRKVSVKMARDGHKRIFLNNKVLFNSGLLDQGYYHDGYLTPPNDEALINDITLAKEMGFNVLRKHIKIEWERFYYHCDRLGMMVWQDFVNGGASYKFMTVHVPAFLNIAFDDRKHYLFGRSDEKGRFDFIEEIHRTIEHLYNYPSIILWTVFNEGWGQFDAKLVLPLVEKLDPTRLIDIVSGWHDQKNGQFLSRHVYFRKYRHYPDRFGRATILSEFGGYSSKVKDHYFGVGNFGYKKFKTSEKIQNAFIKLYEKEIMPAVKEGLCAAIYTQLSDVEDELNGMITYDRAVIKFDKEVVKRINERLIKGH